MAYVRIHYITGEDTLGGRAGDAREVFTLEAHDEAEHAMVQLQSEVAEKQGRCCWDNCLGRKTSMEKCPCSKTYMRCEECSICMGRMFISARGGGKTVTGNSTSTTI